MSKHHFRHLLVTESGPTGKKLLGLLAKDDIARAFPSDHNPFSPQPTEKIVPDPISKIMIPNAATVEPYCAIEQPPHILRTPPITPLPPLPTRTPLALLTQTHPHAAPLPTTPPHAPAA